MRQVVAHVISGLSRWYTHNITHGAEPLDYAAAWNAQAALPRGNAERLVLLVEAADEFAALVASTDRDASCQVFWSRRAARAWLQRAATETAIHLRDAQDVLAVVRARPCTIEPVAAQRRKALLVLIVSVPVGRLKSMPSRAMVIGPS